MADAGSAFQRPDLVWPRPDVPWAFANACTLERWAPFFGEGQGLCRGISISRMGRLSASRGDESFPVGPSDATFAGAALAFSDGTARALAPPETDTRIPWIRRWI